MRKLRLPPIELLFVLIAASALFLYTFQQLSTDGVIPGNDPAVHLGKAKRIVDDYRVSYTEVAWYPPLFHTIVATLQIFAGTLDVLVAAFILKLLVATFNVLILLSIYLLTRKLFGVGAAVASVTFTFISVPLFEIIFWGGYANFMGLGYIALVFYILNRDFSVSVKTFLLFIGSFTIVLTQQLATFVFVLMFVPAFIVSTMGSGKKLLIFLAVIVGGGLAMLAWYARILLQYADIVIEHLFFSLEENVYHISSVEFEALNKNLGVTLYLTLVGIPLTFFLIKKKKAPKSALLIIFWLAVPFFLSQTHLVGIYLPYHRFVYFFAMPMGILAGVTVYYFAKMIAQVIPRLTQKFTSRIETVYTIKIGVVVVLVASLLAAQGFIFLQRVETYPQFYERASFASYDSGVWIKYHSIPNGTIIVPRSPGSWFYIFSGHHTMEETDPLYSRNVVAESVLYSFFETENSQTLAREYAPESPYAGQAIYISLYNIWKKAVYSPNDQAKVIYEKLLVGGEVPMTLSETFEEIYWAKNSTDETQLVSEYHHELFTARKQVTLLSNSSVVHVKWEVEAHQDLQAVKLALSNYMEPSFDFNESLIPGVLEWQNPWDNPTYVNARREWSVVEGASDMLSEGLVAVLDPENGILVVFEFDDIPDWFTLGALNNRFIDALRLRYELGDLNKGEIGEVSYSIFVYAFEFQDSERWTEAALRQKLSAETYLPLQARDYRTFIDEYNIKFVAVDTQKMLSNMNATPALDIIYDNGRAIVYTTKR